MVASYGGFNTSLISSSCHSLVMSLTRLYWSDTLLISALSTGRTTGTSGYDDDTRNILAFAYISEIKSTYHGGKHPSTFLSIIAYISYQCRSATSTDMHTDAKHNAPTDSLLSTLVIDDDSENGDSSRVNLRPPFSSSSSGGGVPGGESGSSIGFGPNRAKSISYSASISTKFASSSSNSILYLSLA